MTVKCCRILLKSVEDAKTELLKQIERALAKKVKSDKRLVKG